MAKIGTERNIKNLKLSNIIYGNPEVITQLVKYFPSMREALCLICNIQKKSVMITWEVEVGGLGHEGQSKILW